MRRALFVAGDRSLTRFHADALAESDDPWHPARAHSGLEAKVLIQHGRRPFDVVIVAARLPDMDPLELIAQLRKLDATREVPLFLMTERGRDARSRRLAAARYRLAGLIELPTTAQRVCEALASVQKRRRVLVMEPREHLRERYQIVLERAGFVPLVVGTPRDVLDRRKSFEPDLVALAVDSGRPDAGGSESSPGRYPRGVPEDDPTIANEPSPFALCTALKRTARPPKILLYGPHSALNYRIPRNEDRADDFVPAPFDDELLAVRAAALVGLGAPGLPPHQPLSPQSTPETSTKVSAISGLSENGGRSASPPTRFSTDAIRRSSRRVPCEVLLTLETDGRTLEASTLDISPGGMFFALDPPPRVGTKVRLRFFLDEGAEPILAQGRVAWVITRGPSDARGAGVEFTAIGELELKRIVGYVNRLSGVLYAPDPGEAEVPS